MTKRKNSVEDTVSKFFGENKKELSDELFDGGASRGLVNISLSRITRDKNQPRKTFDKESIGELAQSIKEQGIINPITVRPRGKKFVIIAGERRFLAAKKAGLKTVPALIKKVSKNDVILISLIENLQREDLNSIDRAEGIKALKVNLGLPWREVAKKLGLSKQRVLDLVGLLDLPEEIKRDIRNKKLTEKHGRALRRLKGKKDEVIKVSKIAKREKLSGEDTLKLARKVKNRFGTNKPGPGKDRFRGEVGKNVCTEVIKACRRLSEKIEKARANYPPDSKLSPEAREELRKVLGKVSRQIDDFITTYNL
ncbi:MAG: ParB/RepB/Spo0J family partition protein [Candidatus Humimicrobiaceae bacterium]